MSASLSFERRGSGSHLRPSEQPLFEERTDSQDVGSDDAEADD